MQSAGIAFYRRNGYSAVGVGFGGGKRGPSSSVQRPQGGTVVNHITTKKPIEFRGGIYGMTI